MASTQRNRKSDQKMIVLSFMANIPTVLTGFLIGAAVAVNYDKIDVIPMFTLAAFIFYTAMVIIWRLVGFMSRYRFFIKLSNQLLYCEAIFLIVVYAFNLYVDHTMFPVDPLI